jgi:hypothetical protein
VDEISAKGESDVQAKQVVAVRLSQSEREDEERAFPARLEAVRLDTPST